MSEKNFDKNYDKMKKIYERYIPNEKIRETNVTDLVKEKKQSLQEKYRLKTHDSESFVNDMEIDYTFEERAEMRDFENDIHTITSNLDVINSQLGLWEYEKKHGNLEKHKEFIKTDMFYDGSHRIDFSNPIQLEKTIDDIEHTEKLLKLAIDKNPEIQSLKDNLTQYREKTQDTLKRLKRLKKDVSSLDMAISNIRYTKDFYRIKSDVDNIFLKWQNKM